MKKDFKQSEQKKTLHFQNGTKTEAAYSKLHTYTNRQENSS
jgi:hypothetical protein